MVLLLSCSKTGVEELSSVLKETGIDFIVGYSENQIMKCDRVIFPDCADIPASLRKLHLFNMPNILKILRKPLLAINNGTALLCSELRHIGRQGIDIFPNNTLELPDIEQTGFSGNLETELSDRPLFSGISSGTEFLYRTGYYIEPQNNACAYTTISGKKVPACIEYKNYTGLLFKPESSGEAGKKILQNFAGI